MIHLVDETIRQILIQKAAINPEEIDIQFQRPNQEWESRLSKATVNCFLYDIRENLGLRFDQQRYLTRNGNKGTENTAPARIDFTYLITVWMIAGADSSTAMNSEHRMLGNILQTLLRYPILPTELLPGDLQNQPYPVRAWISQPEDVPKVWEFWGANEWRLKAGLSYRMTVAVEPMAATDVELVRETVLNIEQR